jgi:hypothetical protein
LVLFSSSGQWQEEGVFYYCLTGYKNGMLGNQQILTPFEREGSERQKEGLSRQVTVRCCLLRSKTEKGGVAGRGITKKARVEARLQKE